MQTSVRPTSGYTTEIVVQTSCGLLRRSVQRPDRKLFLWPYDSMLCTHWISILSQKGELMFYRNYVVLWSQGALKALFLRKVEKSMNELYVKGSGITIIYALVIIYGKHGANDFCKIQNDHKIVSKVHILFQKYRRVTCRFKLESDRLYKFLVVYVPTNSSELCSFLFYRLINVLAI